MEEIADQVIELLEVTDGLPKVHHAAKLVVGTLVGLVAGGYAQKAYVKIYQSVKSR